MECNGFTPAPKSQSGDRAAEQIDYSDFTTICHVIYSYACDGPYCMEIRDVFRQAAVYVEKSVLIKHDCNASRRISRRNEIFNKFTTLLKSSAPVSRNVSFYADKLCITPKHLSKTIKEISGKGVKEWIDNYAIIEIRILLQSSNMSVKEICDRLGFANQSFFGKYFRHHTGMSPTEYIKSCCESK